MEVPGQTESLANSGRGSGSSCACCEAVNQLGMLIILAEAEAEALMMKDFSSFYARQSGPDAKKLKVPRLSLQPGSERQLSGNGGSKTQQGGKLPHNFQLKKMQQADKVVEASSDHFKHRYDRDAESTAAPYSRNHNAPLTSRNCSGRPDLKPSWDSSLTAGWTETGGMLTARRAPSQAPYALLSARVSGSWQGGRASMSHGRPTGQATMPSARGPKPTPTLESSDVQNKARPQIDDSPANRTLPPPDAPAVTRKVPSQDFATAKDAPSIGAQATRMSTNEPSKVAQVVPKLSLPLHSPFLNIEAALIPDVGQHPRNTLAQKKGSVTDSDRTVAAHQDDAHRVGGSSPTSSQILCAVVSIDESIPDTSAPKDVPSTLGQQGVQSRQQDKTGGSVRAGADKIASKVPNMNMGKLWLQKFSTPQDGWQADINDRGRSEADGRKVVNVADEEEFPPLPLTKREIYDTVSQLPQQRRQPRDKRGGGNGNGGKGRQRRMSMPAYGGGYGGECSQAYGPVKASVNRGPALGQGGGDGRSQRHYSTSGHGNAWLASGKLAAAAFAAVAESMSGLDKDIDVRSSLDQLRTGRRGNYQH